MEQILSVLGEQWPGFLTGLLTGVLPTSLISFLRRDSARKLADADPSNDGVALAEQAIADGLAKRFGEPTQGK